MVKVTGEVAPVDMPKRSGGSAQFHEVTVGDDTGKVILSLKDFQIEGLEKDKVICVRNGTVRMVKGYIRIVVDKWGKLDKDVTDTIEEVGSTNVSTTEYELCRAERWQSCRKGVQGSYELRLYPIASQLA